MGPVQRTSARGTRAAMLSLKSAVSHAAHQVVCRQALLALRASPSCLGFVGFVWLVPDEEIVLDRNADGIVVLTGGTSRVTDALELLAAGRGKRLLISGVNPGTTTSDIAHQVSEYSRFLSCCVDLDYSALNTLGNAVETRRWVDRPRLSFAHHRHVGLPHAARARRDRPPASRRRADPVPGRRRTGCASSRGGRTATTTRLVLSEYFKYLFAKVRMRFDSRDRRGHRQSRLRRSPALMRRAGNRFHSIESPIVAFPCPDSSASLLFNCCSM